MEYCFNPQRVLLTILNVRKVAMLSSIQALTVHRIHPTMAKSP